MATPAEIRNLLIEIFPTLDIDAVMNDYPNIPLDNLANILYEIPFDDTTYHTAVEPNNDAETINTAAMRPPEINYSNRIDELLNALLMNLRNDLLSKPSNTKRGNERKSVFKKIRIFLSNAHPYQNLLKATFPGIPSAYFDNISKLTSNRHISSFIVAFLAFNRRLDCLDGIFPTALVDYIPRNENIVLTQKIQDSEYQNVNEIIGVIQTFNDIVDPETLVLLHQFDCDICYDKFSENATIGCNVNQTVDNIEANECHRFCHQCVKRQIATNAEEMRLAEYGAAMTCMMPNCNRPIYICEIRFLLDAQMIKRIDERVQSETIALLGLKIEQCKNCNFAIEIEKPKELYRVFRCENCDKAWCRICGAEWNSGHYGVKCKEVVNKLSDSDREKYMANVNARLTDIVARKCHNCFLPYVKNEGCNHISCRCGATQCYLCRAENVGYNHFCDDEYDPVNRKCIDNECGKCPLFVDPTEADNIAVQNVMREVPGYVNPRRSRWPRWLSCWGDPRDHRNRRPTQRRRH